MIKDNDFFTKRNDHSQIIEYNNPQLNKIAARWPAKAVAQLSFSQ